MTAIFSDIKAFRNTPKQQEPIPGMHYAETLYADDTLLFGTHTHTINKLLHQVQIESGKYNKRLNFDKCINLTINRKQSSIKFLDGTDVPRKKQATYLGATLTDAIDNHKEINKRIGEADAVTKQLRLFLLQGSNYQKVGATGSRFRRFRKTNICPGDNALETIQLTQHEQDQLDVFQTKMLRRILNVPPTHLDRSWTNQRVIHTLTQEHGYKHVPLSLKWKQRKIILLDHILRCAPSDPMREVLFEQGTYAPRIERIKRVGKPRANWLLESCSDAYAIIHPGSQFETNNQQHWTDIVNKAVHLEPPFQTKSEPARTLKWL